MSSKVTLMKLEFEGEGDLGEEPNVAIYAIRHSTPGRDGTILVENMIVRHTGPNYTVGPNYTASLSVSTESESVVGAISDMARKLRRLADALDQSSKATESGFPSFSRYSDD